jgi:hypothetical protein
VLVFPILLLLVTLASGMAATLLALLAMPAVRERGADAERRYGRGDDDVAKCFHLDLLWLMQGCPAPRM